MIQDTLRFLTGRAFLSPGPDTSELSERDMHMISLLESFIEDGLDGGLQIASFASQLFERNRNALFAQTFANSHGHSHILNQSQRTAFLASVCKLLAQRTDAQAPSLPLSTLGHFYVFDLVREYNSRLEEAQVDGNAQEPDLAWVVGVREVYENYLKNTPDLGELKEHFDRLGNSFPYADPVSPEEALAKALGISPTPNPDGLASQLDSSPEETKVAPQGAHIDDTYSISELSSRVNLALNDDIV